jgi:hypothetical protein
MGRLTKTLFPIGTRFLGQLSDTVAPIPMVLESWSQSGSYVTLVLDDGTRLPPFVVEVLPPLIP